tara:strand:- start:1509 stop:2126 length:618 start_codon:yes stop_codon:yes gene_type:complete
MSIVIIDYGLSNLNSVLNTIKNIHNNVIITKDKTELLSANILILPGVGTYADGIKNIIEYDLFNTIRLCVLEKKIPIIGICLGMQLLATCGYEGGKTAGLNLIEGEVTKIISSDKKYRIPHIGWNEIIHKNQSLFNNIPNNTDFYFVHSYEFIVKYKSDILATTNYSSEIISAIHRDNIYGFQFHPEKSQIAGKNLLRNIIQKYI